MKKYPKVPRHDLEFVPEELFTSKDLVLLEKMDGMNFRFTQYEERFHDEYSKEILDHNPSDGDIVFGTKSVVRGCVEQDILDFASELHPSIKPLQQVSKQKISEYQDEYGPIIWFAENMIPHTLNYDYESDPPPGLIGFDLYLPRRDERTSEDFDPNPYKERFVGYMEYNTAMEMFEEIGIETAPLIATIEDFNGVFNPEEFTVPESKYTSEQAEGVVIRSDSLQIRSKYVRQSFREMHKFGMGSNANKTEDPEQWILDSIITPARIRKSIRKSVKHHGLEFAVEEEFLNEVTNHVLYDGWSEEFSEIRTISQPIKPSRIHQNAYKKVKSVADRMKQTSARTGERPEDTWMMLDEPVPDESAAPKQYDDQALRNIEIAISKETQHRDVSSERVLVEQLLGINRIHEIVNEVSNGKIENSLIPPSISRAEDAFWVNDRSQKFLWRLSVEFNPNQIRAVIIEEIKQYISEVTGNNR